MFNDNGQYRRRRKEPRKTNITTNETKTGCIHICTVLKQSCTTTAAVNTLIVFLLVHFVNFLRFIGLNVKEVGVYVNGLTINEVNCVSITVFTFVCAYQMSFVYAPLYEANSN